MKLKMEDGQAVLTEQGGQQLPVVVYDNGTEAPLNFPQLIADAKARAEEREQYKAEAAKAKEKLESFTSHLNGEDPQEWLAKAKKAMETVSGLSEGELLTTEKLEKMKEEEAANWRTKLSQVEKEAQETQQELQKKIDGLTNTNSEMQIGHAFSTSPFVREKLRKLPADMVRAYFGRYFEPSEEHKRLIAKDSRGKVIRDPANPSEPASFDDALSILVNEHPDRERLLAGSGSDGPGAPSKSTGGTPSDKTISRAEFEGKGAHERARLMGEGFILTD